MSFQDQFKQYNIENYGYIRLPKIDISKEQKEAVGLKESATNYEFLLQLARKGFKKKQGKIKKERWKEYGARVKTEIELLEELGFIDYILLVWIVCNKADELGVWRDFGRGSVAGSLICWLIGISGVDPIDKHLFFERFVSKTRAGKKIINGETYLKGNLLADVDLNLGNGREEIVKWLNEIYPNRVSKIINFSTLTTRILLKDVSKIYKEYSEDEAKAVSDMISSKFGVVQEIEDAYKENEKFKQWADENKEIVNISKKLSGLLRQTSIHASGYLVSFFELNDIIPLERSKEGDLVSGYDMRQVSDFATKLDLLGLTTNGIIKDVLKSIPEKIDDLNLDNDPVIYDQYQTNTLLPYGLYQISAHCAYGVLNKVKPKNIEELSDVNSLARPGALAYVDSYVKGDAKLLNPLFEPILKGTRNLCLYQETLMQLAVAIGFTLDDAEVIRKCVTGDTMFVSKTRGWISINTLLNDGYKDDLFLVMDENGKQSWQKVTDIWSTGIHQTNRVECRNGLEVRATGLHQFLTDTGWKVRKYLTNEDYIVCANSVEYDGQELLNNDWINILIGLITEGYFVNYSHSHFTNYDKELMDIFVNSYKNLFGEFPSMGNDGKVARISNSAKGKISKYLKFGKSLNKEIPNILMGTSLEQSRRILGLFFSFEGCCLNDGHLEMCSKSKTIIQQVKLLLLRFGIHPSFFVKNNKEYGDFYYLNIGQYKYIKLFYQEFNQYICSTKLNLIKSLLKIGRKENHTNDLVPHSIVQKAINQYAGVCNGDFGTGSFYKENVSRTKFNRFCELTKDKEWINFANGKQYYSQVTSTNYETREVETFDFTVNEDTPYIIANGMVIHNCVGKKLRDKVKEWEEKIYKKANEMGFGKEVADAYWKLVNESASYSFNKSHSVATAYLSALTTYLKYKYPLQFYTSCLKGTRELADPIGEIHEIVKELPYFNIKLLPPDIIKSDLDFKIEDGNIRFGLSHIKGISGATIEKLLNFRREATTTKFQLFEVAQQCSIPINVLAGLIYCGCLDGKGQNRARLVLEAQTYNILTEKEKILVHKLSADYNEDLLTIIKELTTRNDEKGKPYIKESRFGTIKKKYDPYKQIYLQNSRNEELCSYIMERIFLGFSYTSSLQKIYEPKYKGLRSIKDCNSEPKDIMVKFGGFITEIRKGKTKAKSTPYIKVQLSDETGGCQIMMFGEDKIKNIENFHGKELEEDQIIVVEGKSVGENTYFADCIFIQDIPIKLKVSEINKDIKI